MADIEELEELKGAIKEMVAMFKTVWDEVERQFSELPREERHRIFSVIAPIVIDVFAMAAGEGKMEEAAKPSSRRKKRR
jgi:hypothetical protein